MRRGDYLRASGQVEGSEGQLKGQRHSGCEHGMVQTGQLGALLLGESTVVSGPVIDSSGPENLRDGIRSVLVVTRPLGVL